MILMMLATPGLQSVFELIPEDELEGDFIPEQKPRLSMRGWMNGTFQDSLVPWLEENTGFHATFVKLHNQYDYSLFREIHAEGIVRGKGGQLFEEDYIRAWLGEDFMGESHLDKKMRQLRFLQQYMNDSLDIRLILVIEPGKASVYDEDIPASYMDRKKPQNNYEYIVNRAKAYNVDLLDLNNFFLAIKDSSRYPLFPRQGTHWSEFAMWYAADTMIRYMEQTPGIVMPDLLRDTVVLSGDLRSTDYDVGRTLNLLCELDHPAMPYPVYRYEKSQKAMKPAVLAVADSYYWNIYNAGIPDSLFANKAFWYFYNHVYPEFWVDGTTISDLNIKQEVEKQDVILLMMTERFLYKFDRGFVDDLYALYGLPSLTDKIMRYKTKITNLDSWFNQLVEKAVYDSSSLEEILDREAWYLLWSEDPVSFYTLRGWEPLAHDIRNDSAWFAGVCQRASENNQEIEARLQIEAEYTLGQRYPEALKNYQLIEKAKADIRSDSSEYNNLIDKAKYYFMTNEEMLQAEAERAVLNEERR